MFEAKSDIEHKKLQIYINSKGFHQTLHTIRKRKLTVADKVKDFTFVSRYNCSTVLLKCTKKPVKIRHSLGIDNYTASRASETIKMAA